MAAVRYQKNIDHTGSIKHNAPERGRWAVGLCVNRMTAGSRRILAQGPIREKDGLFLVGRE